MKNDGISLIALIITIISIIIIASITLFNAGKEPDYAIRSNFTSEINDLKVALGTKRANNFNEYEEMEKGFKEVTLINAPNDFISFSSTPGEVKGYLIDLELLGYTNLKRGNGSVSGDTVTFDKDDVYVYDKNGTVYYAKGFREETKVYYNATIYKED